MKINRAYKTELDPNNRQRTLLLKSAGAARWAYNWALHRKIESYEETGKSPTGVDLNRELNVLKKRSLEEGGVPWMYEVSKWSPQGALQNLDRAFDRFFRRCRTGTRKVGFPKFKSKKNGIGNFTLIGSIRVKKARIQLPRLGSIKLKEKGYLPIDGTAGIKILYATVSEKAGRWYVSLTVGQEIPDPIITDTHVVGVDVGIKELATTSDGEVFENPRAYKKAQRRLRFLQKEVNRKQKGSKNREKAKIRVAKQHQRTANIRRDNQHKASTAIVKSAGVIVLESLNVQGMLKNRKLSKALSDASISEFFRQLKYKAKWAGKQVIEANRWYPSSKTCSSCGSIKDALGLGERTFSCDSCGFVLDRDLNAAINLRNLAGSFPVTACCPGSATQNATGSEQLLVGQEPNTEQGKSLFGSV
jgi:putative transposase